MPFGPADDGATWTQVWENTSEVVDSVDSDELRHRAAVADGSDAVRIRWIMGPATVAVLGMESR